MLKVARHCPRAERAYSSVFGHDVAKALPLHGSALQHDFHMDALVRGSQLREHRIRASSANGSRREPSNLTNTSCLAPCLKLLRELGQHVGKIENTEPRA